MIANSFKYGYAIRWHAYSCNVTTRTTEIMSSECLILIIMICYRLKCAHTIFSGCDALTDIDSGWFNMTAGISGIWSYGAVAEYSCNTGYVLSHNNLSFDNNGPVNRTCLSSGEWSGIRPFCQLVDCDRNVTIPVNGNVTYENDTTFGNEAFVNCSEGYWLNGSHTLTCTEDGTWSPKSPMCSAISMDI